MTSRDTVLRWRPIAAAVVHTARRHAWRILAVSIVVSAVTVAVELAADHLLSRANLTSALLGSLSTSTVSLLGAVFLSGFLCRLVGDTEHGGTGHGASTGHRETGQDAHATRIRDVLRSLPWGALIVADLLTAVIILAGFVALIIPGLVAITLLAVVGPVIEIEHQPPGRACAGRRTWSGRISGGSRSSGRCRCSCPTGSWPSCPTRPGPPTS